MSLGLVVIDPNIPYLPYQVTILIKPNTTTLVKLFPTLVLTRKRQECRFSVGPIRAGGGPCVVTRMGNYMGLNWRLPPLATLKLEVKNFSTLQNHIDVKWWETPTGTFFSIRSYHFINASFIPFCSSATTTPASHPQRWGWKIFDPPKTHLFNRCKLMRNT